MSARIVVGVDGSDHADRALQYAIADAARRDDAVVEAVHSYYALVYQRDTELGHGPLPTREELEAEAMDRLQRALQGVAQDVPIEPVVVADSPSRALIEAARDADLLVVGSRGQGGFRGLLLGSTSLQVVTHASCPVVVVPALPGAYRRDPTRRQQ